MPFFSKSADFFEYRHFRYYERKNFIYRMIEPGYGITTSDALAGSPRECQPFFKDAWDDGVRSAVQPNLCRKTPQYKTMDGLLLHLKTGPESSCRDRPAVTNRIYKDICPGTWALLTLLSGADGENGMIHVAWRTMAHEQPSEVMTVAEVASIFEVA